MKKRFIVSVAPATALQDLSFIAYLKNLRNEFGWGIGWWHWAGAWLISDPQGKFTASSLLEGVRLMYPGVNAVVLELRQDGTDSWAAFGPANTMLKWLRDQWTW